MIAATAKIHPSSIIEDGAAIGENVKITHSPKVPITTIKLGGFSRLASHAAI